MIIIAIIIVSGLSIHGWGSPPTSEVEKPPEGVGRNVPEKAHLNWVPMYEEAFTSLQS